jgi:DEAD/DEAH box helicase domain-containing protein
VATNALELGIDVGHLEATLITGYPGSIASTWQQAGRSGRSGRRAITILVGRNDPLDQYLMSHPESFFNKRFENALVNPDNPYILDNHLLCAAWENPLTDQDSAIFGSYFSQALDRLVSSGRITKRHERWFLSAGSDYPAKSVDIRSCSGTAVSIVNMGNGSIVDSMDRSNALFQAHPGAVYLNQGDSYLISELNIENNIALAQPVDSSYYTIADDLTTLRIIKEQRCRYVANTRVCLGQVEVKTAIIAYKKREQFSEKLLDTLPLDLPDDTFNSIGLWFDINPGIVSELNQKRLDLAGGLHAIEHASIGILPLFALCDRNDIGGVSTVLHSDTGKPQVFIYDAHPGGIGIAEKGYEMITELWRAVFQLLTSCGCDEGCPGCIQSPKCGNNNQPLDKKAAIKILQMLIY